MGSHWVRSKHEWDPVGSSSRMIILLVASSHGVIHSRLLFPREKGYLLCRLGVGRNNGRGFCRCVQRRCLAPRPESGTGYSELLMTWIVEGLIHILPQILRNAVFEGGRGEPGRTVLSEVGGTSQHTPRNQKGHPIFRMV